MEAVSDKVKRFLLVDGGSGYGCGDGSGDGDGSGIGSGIGSVVGIGIGHGDGSGIGSVVGIGGGCGSGIGSGCGRGSGYGGGYERYVTSYCGTPVYMIDGVATIIRSVFRDCAKGYILQGDLTVTPCYVAKGGGHFAHGDTLAGAVEALRDKLFDEMDEDERIAAFWECHERGVKYPAADLYEWHHKLTGSCEAGRKAFASDHGVDLETDTYTVEEFVAMCKDSYGGDIIRRLMEDEDGTERIH